MPLPGKVERPQWVTRPRRIKAGSNAAEPRLYGVWCQTPDVEADRRELFAPLSLPPDREDPSGFFFMRIAPAMGVHGEGVMFQDGRRQ